MVTHQLSLLDTATSTPVQDAPRCRMCARPARMTKRGWGLYCNGGHCSNRERLCQSCGQPFHVNVGLAGTKYCAPCKATGRPDRPWVGQGIPCAWCGERGASPHRGRGTWPYICTPCLDPIKHVVERLKAHHVPHERARQLVQNPGCEVCGTNVLTRIREAGHGQPRALLVVDHDHNCCPASRMSCGQCIRGLICRDCNTAAGMLADEPKRARALGDYLEAWSNR